MSGPDYNSGYPPQPQGGYPPQPQGGYPPPQPQGYPPHQGYPPQGYPPQGYPAEGGYAQPFGMAQPAYYPQGGYVPPPGLPTECFGGFWIRLGAYLIDGMILFVPLQLLSVLIRVSVGLPALADTTPRVGAAPNPRETSVSLMLNLVFLGVSWLYFAFMHHKKGASLGKLAVGLRVVDQFGAFPSLGQATGRFFATILSGCVCYVGYIVAAFDPQKRCWHDKLANTYVVKKEYAHPSTMQAQ